MIGEPIYTSDEAEFTQGEIKQTIEISTERRHQEWMGLQVIIS
jgi:hypothetical protein